MESSISTPEQLLAGRHAFVTGASRGIGASIARELGRLGAKLTLAARNQEALDKVSSEIRKTHGVETQTLILDVTDFSTITNIVNQSQAEFGLVDILVNNAGAAVSAPFHRTKLDSWQAMLNINLTGPFLLTQALLPGMLKQKWGRIISIASTASLKGYGYVSPYCAAKHGILGLTRSLAIEYAASGITFNAVCPGFTKTDIATHTINTMVEKTGRTEEEALATLTSLNPQGRLVAPEEVAQTVGWLALQTSASINGQAIAVAGGEVM